MKRLFLIIFFLSLFNCLAQDFANNPFVYEKTFTTLGDYTYSVQINGRSEITTGRVSLYKSSKYLYAYVPDSAITITYLTHELVAVNSIENKRAQVWSLSYFNISDTIIEVHYMVKEGTAIVIYRREQ